MTNFLSNTFENAQKFQILPITLPKNELYVVCYYFFIRSCYSYALSFIKSERDDIPVCKGKFPPDAHKWYLKLFQKGKVRNESRKRVSDDVVETVDDIQQSATSSDNWRYDAADCWMPSTLLTGWQMFKKQVLSIVQNIKGLCLFMEGNMCYLCFFVIWQKSAINGNQRVGLPRRAGTMFATWFYSMHQLLHQKRHLKLQFTP